MSPDWWWGYLAGALTILVLAVALIVLSAFILIRGAEHGVPMARTWTGDVTPEQWAAVEQAYRDSDPDHPDGATR